MATAARTVTVNAAFLREIKEDNRELKELLSRTAYFLGEPLEVAPAKELVELLVNLRDRLAMHFALEEAYGYFEDALTIAPRLSSRADSLRAEHGTLFVCLCQIVNSAEGHLYRESPAAEFGEIRSAFRQFHVALDEHEANENDLIMQAFDDDIGVGD